MARHPGNHRPAPIARTKGHHVRSVDHPVEQRPPLLAARDRERLEKVCRYAGRPEVAESRLVELGGGRIGYALKKRWRDGTAAVVVTQEVLMERLCALLPRPWQHLVTYHGVLAPASGLRSRMVPRREGDAGVAWGCRHGDGDGVAAVASADLDEAGLRPQRPPSARAGSRSARMRCTSFPGSAPARFVITITDSSSFGNRR